MCPQPDEQSVPQQFNIRLAKGKRIPVRVYGRGKKIMVALHGFDYDGTVFEPWEAILGEHYTICVPDLPFHGAAEWDEKQFSREHLVRIIRAIATEKQCTALTLTGHSLGARILVCTAQDLMDIAERYILLAPAGIGAFDRVTPLWGQRIAEWALRRPAWLRHGISLGHKMGLVSNFHRRYAEVQLYPAQQRHRLFRTYNSLLSFSTSRPDIVSYWQNNQIATLLLLAEQDRFVPNHKIREFFAEVPAVHLEEAPGNHDLVNTRTAEIIRAAVQRP